MRYVNPYIYIDYSGDLWKFIVNEKKELCYKIMYGEGKWTKDNIIDKDVLGFSVYINEDETIHIAYNNIKGEIKYCTMEEKQWVGRVLFKNEVSNFKIENLEMIILGSEMHIFYMQIDNFGNDHGILNHYIWNGKEIKKILLQDIILVRDMEKYFSININSNNKITIFFMNDEGDEISLNTRNFEKYIWSPVKRFYGIQGEEINFEVISDDDEIHIINKSKEDLLYYLEYVSINMNGDINQFKVYESSSKLINTIIFMQDYKIYSCWVEGNKIAYSSFENQVWTKPNYINNDKIVLKKCKCFLWNKSENTLKRVEVYITDEIDMNMFIPNNFVLNSTFKGYEINYTRENAGDEKCSLEKLKLELSKVKIQKSKLQKRVDYLELHLKKNERLIDEYEERINIISEQKRKSEENYKVFMELQQNIQKELNEVKKDLEEEATLNEKYKIEVDRINKELLEKEKINIKMKTELEEVNQLLSSEQNYKTMLENKLKDKEEENNNIKKQIESISLEKNQLEQELEIERNQSIMDRLLRKRSGGI